MSTNTSSNSKIASHGFTDENKHTAYSGLHKFTDLQLSTKISNKMSKFSARVLYNSSMIGALPVQGGNLHMGGNASPLISDKNKELIRSMFYEDTQISLTNEATQFRLHYKTI